MITTSAGNKSILLYPLKNFLNCDVIVAFEMYDASCAICNSGTVTIPANSTVNLPQCLPFGEICIIIMDIGGSTPATNHSNVIGNCHSMTPYGQSGSGIGAACSASGNWSATHAAGSWSIN